MPSSLDDFEILYAIGSGSYGSCKKIRRKKDGKVLVWKEMDYGEMSETEKQMLVSEVNLLRELKHKHIVRYYDRIVDRTNTTIYIIMEYCEGGDLSTLIKRCSREGRYMEEEFVWKILTQTIQALYECHSRAVRGKAILHRDLKPANVFLDSENNVKLGDFGLARVLHHDTSFAKTFVGTPYYMSPEQVNYMQYNEKSDIWSLGCLLYELCALRPPFTASDQHQLASRIRTGRYARIPLRYSEELNEIISSMILVDEYKRPSIETLIANSGVAKRMTHEKRLSSSSESSLSGSSKSSSLKKKEAVLAALERSLKEREQDLDAREKAVMKREQLADEKLARAERYLEYNQNKLKSLDLNSVNPIETSPLRSCLTSNKKEDSPSKKVTFNEKSDLEKENLINLYKIEEEEYDTVKTNLESKFDIYGSHLQTKFDTKYNIYPSYESRINFPSYNSRTRDTHLNSNYSRDYLKNRNLKERWGKVQKRSDELRKAEIESKIKTRQLLAMR